MPKRKRDADEEPYLFEVPDLATIEDRITGVWDHFSESERELELTESEAIGTLENFKLRVEGALAYINKNEQTLRAKGAFSPKSVRNVTDELNELIPKVENEIARRKFIQDKRVKFANSKVKVRSGAHAGDGNCYITFINIGLGDCTIITTPKGRRLMVDCGSLSLRDVKAVDPDLENDPDITSQEVVISPMTANTFLNGGTRIDLLFLTHPDKDHHNRLQQLLEPLEIEVGFVYFGGADLITAYQSSSYITDIAGEIGAIRQVVVREEKELTVGDDGPEVVLTKTINGTPLDNSGDPDEFAREFVDPTTGAVVIYYEDDEESDFKISVLAANVIGVWNQDLSKFVEDDEEIKTIGESKLDGTEPNKRSLIVLAECHGESTLICGDATAVTERFVVDYFAGLIKNVDYLRMGHHGSPTSSSKKFLDALKKMTMAVASTGGALQRKISLPKKDIIELYLDRVSDGAPEHDIWSFESDDPRAQKYLEDTDRMIWATGSNGDRSLVLRP
jgi:beta-lactamase superfamily II metal-dependent hydrolase